MELIRTQFRAMASDCEIVAASDDPAWTRHAMGLAAREAVRIEQKYSRYRIDDASIVHRINAAAGSSDWIACDEETLHLLDLAAKFHGLSDGLFDITSGVLRRAWNFSAKDCPQAEDIAALLPLIGWTKVELEGRRVRLPLRGMEIDFGGFGKEYAADRAVSVLEGNGIRHGYVNLGGDIRVAGPGVDGKPWRFGVQNPRDVGSVAANIELASGALVTSGDYVKYIEKNGVRFSHILNPRSGMSVSCWRSVSVVGVSATLAGAFSTIAMLKEAEAVQFLDGTGCQYLLVDAEGRCIASCKTSE